MGNGKGSIGIVVVVAIAFCFALTGSAWAATGQASESESSLAAGIVEATTPSGPKASPAVKLGKNTVAATKLSDTKVSLKWSGVSGADGYLVYQGSKKVKTVKAKATSTVVTRKGAGSAKFKVVPYVKDGKKSHTGSSNAAKPKVNEVKYSRQKDVKSYPYMTCSYVVTNVKLSGKAYTVTGYAMNNRMWNMKRYKRLSFSLTANGKKVASKTYKNMYVGAKSYQAKKIVLRIDGKPNIDLRNSTCSLNVSYDPVWVYDSGREIVD